MSVQVIDLQTIKNIEATLMNGAYFQNGHINCLHFEMDSVYYDGKPETPLQTLLKRLARINLISWNERYNDHEPTRNYGQNIRFNGNVTNIYQLLKSLQYLNYQIEGKLRKLNPVIRLGKLIKAIESKIIENLEGYEKATWG